MKKRFFAWMLVLALVVTMIPFRASAATGGKLIAITFDDGPSSTNTKQLLDGLKKRDVKVTFFTLGNLADSNLDLVQRAYEEGHEIASHSWDHPDLNTLSTSAVRSQFSRSFAVLDQVCGKNADYLVRPPYGNANSSVRSVINNPLIYWSVDTRDWDTRDRTAVKNAILNDAYDGAIVLLHDIYSTSVNGALDAIDVLLDRGYELVTVSELYRRRGEKMTDGVFHYSCKPTGVDYGEVPAPKISIKTAADGTTTVTITGSSDAPIYYTLDGSYPNENSTLYTGPFKVKYLTEVTAVAAYKLNGDRSDLTKLTKSVYACLTPTASLNDSNKLVLSTKTPDAAIYYTLNNTTPSTSSAKYSGAVSVPKGSYIQAIAVRSDLKKSGVLKCYYSEYGKLYLDMSPANWYYDEIERLNLAGYYAGTGTYTMDPNSNVTRAMVVALLYRYSGESLGENWERTNRFQDVSASSYYAEAVEWAYRNNIVAGLSSTKFAPDNTATREEVCAIAERFLNYREKPLAEGESNLEDFADYKDVSDWALESVEAAVANGLLYGSNGKLLPKNTATRAEFAAILCRVIDYEEAYVPPVTEETEPSESPEEETTDPSEDPTETTEGTEPPEIETEPVEDGN